MPDIKSNPIAEPVLDLDLPDERISDQENEPEETIHEHKIQRTIVSFKESDLVILKIKCMEFKSVANTHLDTAIFSQ